MHDKPCTTSGEAQSVAVALCRPCQMSQQRDHAKGGVAGKVSPGKR